MFLYFGHFIATMLLCFGHFIGHAFRQPLPIQQGLQHLLVKSSLQGLSNNLPYFKDILHYFTSQFLKIHMLSDVFMTNFILALLTTLHICLCCKQSDKTSANNIEEFSLKICLH
jgi:hypothetical protein